MQTNDKKEIELLTLKDVAKLLLLSESGVRGLQAKRQISYIRVGGALRFEKRDVFDYLQRRKFDAIIYETKRY